jgi:large subunit ribosomal protein L28
MARRCDLTGVGVMAGNNVSHSNRKTRRRFLPNVQEVSLYSDVLKKRFSLKLTAATLRTVEHNGGIDAYLLGTPNIKLTDEAIKIKRQIKKAAATQQAA